MGVDSRVPEFRASQMAPAGGTWVFMQALRKVCFYLFLVLYVVATPLVILYALGYQIRPGQPQALVRTGLISIGSASEGARVFLGSSRYRWKTPTVLRDLKPGDYALRLTLRDHQPWSGTVRVEAEKATVLDHVLLLPNPLVIRRTSTNRYATLYPQPGEQEFLVATGPRAGELAVCDTLRATVKPVLAENDPFAEARLLQLQLVNENPCLLLIAELNGRTTYGWRRLDVEKDPTADISGLFPVAPDAIRWDVRERDDVFTLVSGRVHRLDLDDRALYPDVLQEIQSLATDRGDLIVLDRSNRLYRTSRDGERKPERLGLSPAQANLAWIAQTGYTLLPVDDRVVFLHNTEGQLFVNQPPYELLTRGYRGLLPHPRGASALVWDQHRLGRYAYEETDRPRAAPPLGVQWFHTSPRALDQVFWCHDASHVLVAGDGWVDLLAVSPDDTAPARTLIAYEPGTSVFYSERAGALYYLEPRTRHLMELQLLPRFDLMSLGRARAATNDWTVTRP